MRQTCFVGKKRSAAKVEIRFQHRILFMEEYPSKVPERFEWGLSKRCVTPMKMHTLAFAKALFWGFLFGLIVVSLSYFEWGMKGHFPKIF